jgi:integrase
MKMTGGLVMFKHKGKLLAKKTAGAEACTAPEKGYSLYYDQHKDAPQGFGLRVTAKGVQSFILRYSVNGKARRMTIGQVPTWSLAAARIQAKEYKRQIDGGIDILDKRRTERKQPTVTEAVELFSCEHYDKLLTGASSRSRLERFFVSEFGEWKLNKVRRPEIRAMVRKVAETHGRQAAILLTNLKSLYAWAEDEELIEANPVATMRPAKVAKSMAPVKRTRILDDEEVEGFWKGVDTCGVHKFTALALKLVLVTGARPGEVAGMKWSEINGKTWTIPGARRGKTGTEHIVPLTDTALTLLKEAKAEAKRLAKRRKRGLGDLVFSVSAGKSIEVNALSAAVRKNDQLGGKDHADWGHWTPHDLRRTMRTGLSAGRVPELVAELAIGHTKKGIIGTYDVYHYANEIREALEAWERRLALIIDGKPTDDNKVTPIRRERLA